MDVSVIVDSAKVQSEASEDLVSPDVAIVELSVMDGSGSNLERSSAKTRVGLDCWASHGKIGRGFPEGFSFGTSNHMFLGGLGYR